MPPEPDSDTVTPESVAVQVIRDHPELAKKYASGDVSVLGVMQEKALKLAGRHADEHAIKDTLMRKLGASI